MELVKSVYKLTKEFPKSELYNLVAQINRSAVSIPSNIAEGAGRGTNKDFLNFLSYAQGSAYELNTQLLLSKELGFIKESDFSEIEQYLVEIQKMIFSFQQKLKSEL